MVKNVSEENYGFIRLDRPTQGPLKKRDKLNTIVKIAYVFKVESPLHVGSGFVRKDSNGMVAKDIARNEAGEPIIPGSTIKGCLEANFRYIVKGACGTERCRPRDVNSHICPLCNLFGAMSLGSRIRCSDAQLILTEKQKEQGITTDSITEIIQIPMLTSPNKQERFSVKFYHNIQFDATNDGPIPLWVTKKGAAFKEELILENPTEDELQMIVNSLMYRKKGLQIGMGKNLGMGVIKIQVISISKFNAKDPVKAIEEAKLNPTNFGEFIKNKELFNQDAIDKINSSKGNPFHFGGA